MAKEGRMLEKPVTWLVATQSGLVVVVADDVRSQEGHLRFTIGTLNEADELVAEFAPAGWLYYVRQDG